MIDLILFVMRRTLRPNILIFRHYMIHRPRGPLSTSKSPSSLHEGFVLLELGLRVGPCVARVEKWRYLTVWYFLDSHLFSNVSINRLTCQIEAEDQHTLWYQPTILDRELQLVKKNFRLRRLISSWPQNSLLGIPTSRMSAPQQSLGQEEGGIWLCQGEE